MHWNSLGVAAVMASNGGTKDIFLKSPLVNRAPKRWFSQMRCFTPHLPLLSLYTITHASSALQLAHAPSFTNGIRKECRHYYHYSKQYHWNLPRRCLDVPRAHLISHCTALAIASNPWWHQQRQHLRPFGRPFTTLITNLPTILVPPVVYIGLVLTLWFYKCLMMVVFQNKIIYMPSIPPFSRSEQIEEYETICRPVRWTEKRIRSLDGTRITLCVGEKDAKAGNRQWRADEDMKIQNRARKRVVVLYFQG